MVGVDWIQGYQATVSFCFDVDAEASWIGNPENQRRLSLLSASAFGRRIGVPRILRVLDNYNIKATFFIPGYTAEIDPNLVKTIAESGHAIGCHGYYHERTDELSYEQEDDILARSKMQIKSITGITPLGFRAPLWEITPQTLSLLDKHNFGYDSSLMGLDYPYEVRVPDSNRNILEIPVTWLLDDWEQFAYSAKPADGYVIEEPEKVLRLWLAEFDALYTEGGAFTLTMHPEIIGRASRISILDRLIQHIKQYDGVLICTLDDLYTNWKAGNLSIPTFNY
ncbi:polysaccharide deacetylase [Kyrpidia spormannii]|uniref:Polysaccharide deacetylase n=1 Tax=Kyrpidia spormannii TaxID=2055160 RepID=A0A2K8NAH3_9BACL|nr:polysaccharide deacetylase [Kyrpidia spormannii]